MNRKKNTAATDRLIGAVHGYIYIYFTKYVQFKLMS